jgi:hypothetical protein
VISFTSPQRQQGMPLLALRTGNGKIMARCEQGYLCEVCGQEVGEITESDLYLRYVLGEVPPEQLHILPERHIRCNPALAQYIVDPAFEAVRCEGVFAKEQMDRDFVAAEEARVTRGWRRLQELPSLDIPIIDYPLPPSPG